MTTETETAAVPAPQRPLAVDYVSCELMLETARACRSLLAALETVEVESVDSETLERARRQMTRITLFARLVPSILAPRRIVALCDLCADRPDWWRSNRNHIFCPELTNREIADLLGLRPHQIRDYIRAVEISDDCYANLPELQ